MKFNRSGPSARLLDLEVFPLPSTTTGASSNRRDTHEVTPPTECNHRKSPRIRLELRGASSSFHPLQRTMREEFTIKYAGFTSPDYDPPTGFLTLLAACTSSRPPGLFHPRHAHGVSPSRAFPSRRAVAPHSAHCRLDVRCNLAKPSRTCDVSELRHGRKRPFHKPEPSPVRKQSAFTALLPTRIRFQPAGVEAAGSPMLSWAFASPGIIPLAPWPALPPASSHELAKPALPPARRPTAG